MSDYHCLNCGEKLKQINISLTTDKYECPKCCTTWHRVKHLIIKWVEGEKKVGDAREEGDYEQKN